jgi:hypothetical protein
VEATLAMGRYRSTIIMVVLLVVLGGLALFLSNQNVSSPGIATPTPVVYVWQQPDPVNAIDVVSSTSKISVKKDSALGTWSITQPVSKPADLFSVSAVADSLQKLQATFALTGTSDLTQYGLSPNPMAVTVTFSDTQGTKRTFNVGTSTPDGSGYYVNTAGSNSVYVVSNTTIEPLRTWLTTPPVEQPSPTPIPITVVPVGTETPTATPEASGPQAPSVTPATVATATPASAAPTATATAGP